MRHAWEIREKCRPTRFWWETPKERDHSEDRRRWDQNVSYGDWLVGVEWIQLAQDSDRWRAPVNAVINNRVQAQRSYSHKFCW
jgi:hypothetical protein